MRRVIVLVSVSAAALVATSTWRAVRSGEAVEAPGPARPAPATRAELATPETSEARAPRTERVVVAEESETRADVDAAEPGDAGREAVLRGRLLLPGGVPAAGVPLELHGYSPRKHEPVAWATIWTGSAPRIGRNREHTTSGDWHGPASSMEQEPHQAPPRAF